MMSDAIVEKCTGHFYGVYLLCSQSIEQRYSGKCYIGFTVNPNRRINQHNRGRDFGGAKKTSNKGPWKMVMIIHGFPNNIAALQFEWAWQQPTLSSRLKAYTELKRKLPKETYFQYNFRILNRMLLLGPWNRLPLIIRWLETDYECDFLPTTKPPTHMQIVSGKIAIGKKPSSTLRMTQKSSKLTQSQPRAIWAAECHLCMQRIDNPERSRIGCLNGLCKLTCHIICLVNHMIASHAENSGHYIPIAGQCPLCETQLTWVALLQRKRKMQGALEADADDEDDLDFDWEEEEEIDFQRYNNIDNFDVYEISD